MLHYVGDVRFHILKTGLRGSSLRLLVELVFELDPVHDGSPYSSDGGRRCSVNASRRWRSRLSILPAG
jgi:hypothetical protein